MHGHQKKGQVSRLSIHVVISAGMADDGHNSSRVPHLSVPGQSLAVPGSGACEGEGGGDRCKEYYNIPGGENGVDVRYLSLGARATAGLYTPAPALSESTRPLCIHYHC